VSAHETPADARVGAAGADWCARACPRRRPRACYHGRRSASTETVTQVTQGEPRTVTETETKTKTETDTETETETVTEGPPSLGGGGGGAGDGCLAEYPDVCVPDDGSDYDCPEVDGSDFSVPGDDPMGFDRDGDGVGCET
jgi:hypothetical protein